MWGLITSWKDYLLIGLAICLALLFMRLQTVSAQRDLAEADLRNYKTLAEAAAKAADKESDDAVKSAKQKVTELVEQAKRDAWANYKARYGLGNAACGIRAGSVFDVRPGSGSPSNESTSEPDAASGEQLVIEACARDAGRLNAFIELCRDQQCEVVEE